MLRVLILCFWMVQLAGAQRRGLERGISEFKLACLLRVR